MKKRSFKQDFLILLSCFIISRVIIKLLGITFEYNALLEYWQYLDITSLKTNLLSSLWYQHSQPPVFNFILGILLKLSGQNSFYAIEFFLLALSFCNALLLLQILRKLIANGNLALLLALLYLLSPATMLLENELFYTPFVSFLLLSAVYFLVRFLQDQRLGYLLGIFATLSLVCLTRSMYHLSWLVFVVALFIISLRNKQGVKKVLSAGLLFTIIVAGWYLKNYIIFNNFSASSWVGMNFSRIVFHDTKINDPKNIASIPAFMPASYYAPFINADYKTIYAGLNNSVLLSEKKNETYINMNNAAYLQVSEKYRQSSLDQVYSHPLSYLKEVAVSATIFFTPASSYFKLQDNNHHIRYYDLLYSFNLSHFYKESLSQKKSLVISAIPKFVLYLLVITFFVRRGLKTKSLSLLNSFIIATILFSFVVGSLLDYGENMRFRYEVEPLFLILVAQILHLYKKRQPENQNTNI